MANHESARKRARQALRRQASNRVCRSRVHSAIRAVEEALNKKDAKAAEAALRAAQPELAHAAAEGVIPKTRMARKMSRLAAHIRQVKRG